MSDYERNKGRLYLVTEDVILQEFPNADLNDIAWDTGGVFTKIGENYFRVEWEVEGETDAPEFAEVTENKDGSISFHTYHYNGGAHWTELVEEKLNEAR